MTEKEKESIRIILDNVQNGDLSIDDGLVLLETIFGSKETKEVEKIDYVPWPYPITYPQSPDRYPWTVTYQTSNVAAQTTKKTD